MKETDRIEFKEQLTPELEKEVVSFLNAKGGHIYIGVKTDLKLQLMVMCFRG